MNRSNLPTYNKHIRKYAEQLFFFGKGEPANAGTQGAIKIFQIGAVKIKNLY